MANQKIVLCFEHDEIQGKVKKELVSQKRKNVEIEKCTSKVSVYDVLKQDDVIGLLMTLSCGVETWSLEEIAKIKDSCTKNIVLILQDDMYTTENLTFLYENHVYSCVKAGNKGVNIREVVKLLYQERTPKDARTEYGLSTLSDVNHTDSMEKRYEEKANALVDPNYGGENASLGKKFFLVAQDMTKEQTIEFLDLLDRKLLEQLKTQTEYYEVLTFFGIPHKRPKNLDAYKKQMDEEEQQKKEQERIEEQKRQEEERRLEQKRKEEELKIQEEDDGINLLGVSELELEDAVSQSLDDSFSQDEAEGEEESDDEEQTVEYHSTLAKVICIVSVCAIVMLIAYVAVTVKRHSKPTNEGVQTIYDVTGTDVALDDKKNDFEGPGLVEKQQDEAVSEDSMEEIELSIEDTPDTETESMDTDTTDEVPQNMTTYETKKDTNTEQPAENTNSGTDEKKKNTKTVVSSTVNDVKESIANKVSEVKSQETTSEVAQENVPSYDYEPKTLNSSYKGKTYKDGEEVKGLEVLNFINANLSKKSYRVINADGSDILFQKNEATLSDLNVDGKYVVSTVDNTTTFTEK